MEMGVVVLERKESLEKEFPTRSSQRKLVYANELELGVQRQRVILML